MVGVSRGAGRAWELRFAFNTVTSAMPMTTLVRAWLGWGQRPPAAGVSPIRDRGRDGRTYL